MMYIEFWATRRVSASLITRKTEGRKRSSSILETSCQKDQQHPDTRSEVVLVLLEFVLLCDQPVAVVLVATSHEDHGDAPAQRSDRLGQSRELVSLKNCYVWITQ
jgi:hypothetical protein